MITERNYLDVYPYDKWSESTIPLLNEGEVIVPDKLMMEEGETSAPNLLSEADLISVMDKNGIGMMK
jgi:DNA topoisomerase-3